MLFLPLKNWTSCIWDPSRGLSTQDVCSDASPALSPLPAKVNLNSLGLREDLGLAFYIICWLLEILSRLPSFKKYIVHLFCWLICSIFLFFFWQRRTEYIGSLLGWGIQRTWYITCLQGVYNLVGQTNQILEYNMMRFKIKTCKDATTSQSWTI